jgi:hypothetical protein
MERKKEGMSTGYNWRNTLSDFASVSGILAGFCVAFIALILGGPIADSKICNSDVTFGQIAVLLFGLSTGLLVSSTELFLLAKEFDIFSVPEAYLKLLKEDCDERRKDWATFESKQTQSCRHNERLGRKCYNVAIFIIFGGLFFAIAPYSLPIAGIVSGSGILLESYQLAR